MNSTQPIFQRIIHFPLTRIILGIAIIGGVVVLCESGRQWLLDKTNLSEEWKAGITGFVQISLAVYVYRLFFQWAEKRIITELNTGNFWKYSIAGFFIGLLIQSLIILVIFLAGFYSVDKVNPLSHLLPGLIQSIVAGFIAEIMIRGIFFRILEEVTGTVISLAFMTVLFAILHAGAPGASLVSVCAKALQSGLLLSVVFVYSRSLWLPIFLHFSWDLAEPGIFGGLNPGMAVPTSLIKATIGGPDWLSGGLAGPVNSVPAAFFCLVVSAFLLQKIVSQNRLIAPRWKR